MKAAAAAVLAVATLAACPAPTAGAQEPTVPVVLGLEDQANEIWSAIPARADDPRVTLLGHTAPACASDALRQASQAADWARAGRSALRSLSLSVPLPRRALPAAGTGSADLHPALVGHLLQAPSDHALLPARDMACGPGVVRFDLRALPDQPGRLSLRMLVEGGCGCRGLGASGPSLRRFRVLGQAELEAGGSQIEATKITLRWRVKEPRYSVLGSCRPCGGTPEASPPESVTAAVGPCGQPCAPLRQGAGAWLQEAGHAESELAGLARKATALELDLGTRRQELDKARSASRQSRSVLERIAALQKRVKAVESELSRASRAVEEAQARLGELRRAVDESRAAEQRCQSDCQAKQQKAERASQDAGEGSPGTAAGGVGGVAAGGGGLGTGTVLVGGAIAAAGAGTVLALRKGEEPGFEGTWAGTRLTMVPLRPPTRCVRRWDEVWVISRQGEDLQAHISTTAQSCGTPPEACNLPCDIFTFPRDHVGTAQGSTARFFVFPEFQDASCVLVMQLRGDSLSGTMPACDTGSGAFDTMFNEVTLRRTAR